MEAEAVHNVSFRRTSLRFHSGFFTVYMEFKFINFYILVKIMYNDQI